MTPISEVAVREYAARVHRVMEINAIDQIIVPIAEYRAGDKSDAGERQIMQPAVINKFMSYEEMVKSLTDMLSKQYNLGFDLALSTNVLAVWNIRPPEMYNLQIYDCKPDITEETVKQLAGNFVILKTNNGYHTYCRRGYSTTGLMLENIDPDWKLGYIRVTESEKKGPIARWQPT